MEEDRGRAGRAVRVEHRAPSGVAVLAERVVPLEPLVAMLEAAGEGGEVVLVADGRVVVRWRLGPLPGAGAAD